MLSEIRSQLSESQDRWKNKTSIPSSPSRKEGLNSIQKRLAELNSSADDWRRKVRKDVSPTRKPTQKVHPLEKQTLNYEKLLTPQPSKANTLHNIDSGLNTFFSATVPLTSVTKNEGELQKEEIDLDAIQPSQRLSTPRRLVPRPGRPARRKAGTDRLKAIDVDSVHCEEDLRDHLVIEELDDDMSTPVATSARKGLQSIENYDAAKSALKQADLVSPFPDVMLIRIMGEKKVDVRLVEPKGSSVHQHGCFVLVTPKRLFLYTGSESNILEKTKGAQMTTSIIQKKDLFCTAECVERVEGSAPAFFKILGGDSSNSSFIRPAEPFENLAASANLILRVTDDYKIQSIVKGERPRFKIFQPNETLILDFGSEIYIWSGRNARKTSGRYAKEYVNKLIKCGLGCSEIFGCDMSVKRPEWVIVRRVFQGVQDVLFASKFADWETSEMKNLFKTPISTKQIPRRDPEQDAIDLAEKIKSFEHQLPVLVLEDYEFERQTKDVITEDIAFWVLQGEELEKIEKTNVLWSDECYVVRWQYRIQLSGVRRLKDGSEVERETGRQRIAYFYWLGKWTSPKLQGLCALKLSHMDKEKSPHIRQEQGAEHPVFLELFEGKLLIRDRNLNDHLFVIRGSLSSETTLEQIKKGEPIEESCCLFGGNSQQTSHSSCRCTLF
ncbi:unnamed protein product, partial [Mesorhabditis belari]|uniref:Gelsolin-like domain-containing protein n=1 Tax=Mesorhabditis belari TaxID=2138241 RepID=A0AAF3EDJ4_9BILA